MAVDRAASYKLRSHWKSLFEKTQGSPFRGNVHRDSAQLKAIAEDIGVDETKKLIDFYFEVHREPDFFWFVYNYDKLQEEEARRARDREERRKIREATRRRLEEMS